ncbi:MAG: helix-turn-helix domain-containing protein [Candidatus Brocadiia bacterium]
MTEATKQELLPRARALYAEGLPKRVIAEALDVSPRTLRRWAKQDREAGRPWERNTGKPPAPARRHNGTSPAEMRADLERHLADLVALQGTDQGDGKLEDRMLKVCRVLDHLRDEEDDVGAQLRGLKRFAAWCVRHLSEQDMEPVRRAIRRFLDELKEQHS